MFSGRWVDKLRGKSLIHVKSANFSQYAERNSNKIENTFNRTFAGWKSLHQRFIIHFTWNPSLKVIESISLADLAWILNPAKVLLKVFSITLKIISKYWSMTIFCVFCYFNNNLTLFISIARWKELHLKSIS